MKPISDNLFYFLTLNTVKNHNSIEKYVNLSDGKIYLCKGRDCELYFIVNGKLVLLANNDIDYSKSDSCLFVRNSRTDKVTSFDVRSIKECIEETTLGDYIQELKEIFYQYLNEKHFKQQDSPIKAFKKEVEIATTTLNTLKNGPTEDYVIYANRIANDSDKIKRSRIIMETKSIVERLWLKAFYEPEDKEIIEKYINRILNRVV